MTSSRCGFAINSYAANTTTRVAAAVFPPQYHSGWDRCEFETRTLTEVCDALEATAAGFSAPLRPVGWIHTHPHLGVFLSETDGRTFRQWTDLDPHAVALVLDPFAHGAQWLACNRQPVRIVVEMHATRRQPVFGTTEVERLRTALNRHVATGTCGWHVVGTAGCASGKTNSLWGWIAEAIWLDRGGASPA